MRGDRRPAEGAGSFTCRSPFRRLGARGARAAASPSSSASFAGYQGPKTAAALAKTGTWRLEIVKRNELHRFVVLPKRWIVKATSLLLNLNFPDRL